MAEVINLDSSSASIIAKSYLENVLNKFYKSVEIKPKFMAILCGICNVVYKREDGIYVLPITSLKN